jgi:hypothetical protein
MLGVGREVPDKAPRTMTIENRRLITLDEIVAIQYRCRKCGTTVTVPRERWGDREDLYRTLGEGATTIEHGDNQRIGDAESTAPMLYH